MLCVTTSSVATTVLGSSFLFSFWFAVVETVTPAVAEMSVTTAAANSRTK